jgi:hypothetical protein
VFIDRLPPAESPPMKNCAGSKPSVGRVGLQPGHGVHAFVDGLRKARLGRTRVVDAHHHDAGAARVLAHQAVVGVGAEQHEAAAVDVHQRAGHLHAVGG